MMLRSPAAPVAAPKFAPSVHPDWSKLWRPGYLPARPNGLTFLDIFSGAGGSALGMVAAGYELRLAANHWPVAMATHEANFTEADHLCADVNNYDMRRLPRVDVAWFSPICWEVSPAGGNQKPKFYDAKPRGLFDPDDDDDERREPKNSPGWERTRATAYDVIRATEVWHYKAVLVENVVEFATRWSLFKWWLSGMEALGYQHHIVCVNSAHVEGPDNPATAAWRDRMYVLFFPKGVKLDRGLFEPRPWAHCFDCGEDVRARQTWKRTAMVRKFADVGMIGKYRKQYVYTCPNVGRRHDNPVVEPYVRPAASIINWADLGEPIGQRKRPLEDSTRQKIELGLDMMRTGATMVQVTHAGHDGRLYRPEQLPLSARTVKIGDGLVCPPFIVELRGGGSTIRPASHPAATFSAQGNHHGLTIDPRLPVDDPRWGDGHALVIPYRNEAPRSTQVPLHTLATKDSVALLRPEKDVAVDDLYYRMLRPAEQLLGQRFPREYKVTGTGEQITMQAGNAVSSNVPKDLGEKVAEVLGAAA